MFKRYPRARVESDRAYDRTGFTFIETLVAVFLLSMVFVMGWAISNSFLGVKKTRNYETAVSLANQAIEAVRAARFREIGKNKDARKDTLLADFNSAGNVYDGEKGEGFIPVIKVGGTEFRREISVTDCPSLIDGLPSGLKLIRVTIQWKASEDGYPMIFEAVTTHADQW